MEIVVARHDESVEWVYDAIHHVDRIVIYDKSSLEKDRIESRHARVRVHRLENVGREAHTYLHHIINEWEPDDAGTVPSKTILFTQARYGDHVTEHQFQDLVRGRSRRLTRRGLDIPWHSTAMQVYGWTVETNHDLLGAPMMPAGMSLGDFYTEYIGLGHRGSDEIPSETVEWWQSAIFSTTTDRIQSRSLESYVRLRDILGTHSNPELAHYMERCWYFLFGSKD